MRVTNLGRFKDSEQRKSSSLIDLTHKAYGLYFDLLMSGVKHLPVIFLLAFAIPLPLSGQTDRNSSTAGKKSEAQNKEKSKKASGKLTEKSATPAVSPPAPMTLPQPTVASAHIPAPAPASISTPQDHARFWILGGTAGLTVLNTLLLVFALLRPRAQGSSDSLNCPSPGSDQNSQNDLQRLSRAFAGLHEALDKKDEEIRRHQRGYDQKILKTLLSRLVQVQLFMQDAQAEKPPKESTLQSVADELAMVLDEYGIRAHDPEGEPYRTTPGVATNPKTIPTDRADLKGRIAEVRQKGFFLKTPAGEEVLLPAKVTVYE
jgi:molecular chaperone GrpE (heat shock protein)